MEDAQRHSGFFKKFCVCGDDGADHWDRSGGKGYDKAGRLYAGRAVPGHVGGLAMPVFTFLLVEGFLHTSDYRRYFIRMAVTAAVSEIPYDLAMGNGGLDWGSQNAMVSMCICLLMLRFLQMFRDKKSVGGYMASAAVVLGAVLWVTLLRAQYGLCLVLLTAVFYLLYAKNVWKTVLGILASLLYVTGPLSFYAIWCYNGSRKDRASKYVYYALYPLHLLVFALIARLV